MSKPQFENMVRYIGMPQDLDVESNEYNTMLEKALDEAGKEGWEPYQVNTLMSGEKIRIYFKRRKQ